MTEREKKIIGTPRTKYKYFIGQRAIDDVAAGELTAELLVKTVVREKLFDEDGNIYLLAFGGVRETPFSSNRLKGLEKVLRQYPRVKLLQTIYTDWTEAYARNATPMLVKRYANKKVAGVWCANTALARVWLRRWGNCLGCQAGISLRLVLIGG